MSFIQYIFFHDAKKWELENVSQQTYLNWYIFINYHHFSNKISKISKIC